MAPPLPRVSLVVPAYNAAAWIGETLASVLALEYPADHMDVVVVDDGSGDGTAGIAREILAGARVPGTVLLGENGGPSQARNLGWRAARGEWIQFLDADDLLHPGKLALQAPVAAGAAPEVAVVYSPWQRISRGADGWAPSGAVESPAIGDDPVAELLRPDGFLHTGAALFRREWLERVDGWDERYRLIEDVDLMLRLAMAGGRYQGVPAAEPVFLYRQRVGESLSQRDPRAFVEGCVRNARLAHRYWESRSEVTPERARDLAEVYFYGARFFAEADRAEFERLASALETLVPGFVPAAPRSLRILSLLLGYRRAERVATAYRAVREWTSAGKRS